MVVPPVARLRRHPGWHDLRVSKLQFHDLAKTVHNHYEDIFAYWDSPGRITNAYLRRCDCGHTSGLPDGDHRGQETVNQHRQSNILDGVEPGHHRVRCCDSQSRAAASLRVCAEVHGVHQPHHRHPVE